MNRRPAITRKTPLRGPAAALLSGALLLGMPGCADSSEKMSGEAWKDTAGRSVLIPATDARDEQPAVSPDGSGIAFVSNRGGSWQIWLAALPSGPGGPAAEVRPLTDMPGAVGRPVFEPDGRHLLFYAGQDEQWTIYRMPVPQESDAAEDPTARPVADPVVYAPVESAYSDFRPDPSMDGRWLVFDRWGTSDPPNHDIHVLDRTSGTVRRLTTDPAYDSDARISPDGSMVLFHSDRAGDEPYELQVYLMKRDGSGLRRLTDGPDRHGYPAWCPNGRHVVFTAERRSGAGGTESRIEGLDLETGKVTTIYDAEGRHSSPIVWPSGNRVVFASGTADAGRVNLISVPYPECGSDSSDS